jgi:PIN domain nuclease of toxin-antitoxin system
LSIYVSAITLIEIQYLIEKGRVDVKAMTTLLQEVDQPSPLVELISVDRFIADALAHIPRNDIPDMPDRIIAATALHLGLPLVTADTNIQACAVVTTIW